MVVVVSAVQKKRGHQRGVAREGQQLILSCLCVCIHFVFPGDKKLSDTKFYILSEFLIRCMITLADRGVDLET